MAKTFEMQVEDIIRKNEQRMTALVRESTQRVIDKAQTPTAKGGHMRVDTGFLRASGQMSLNGMPTGPTRGDEGVTYEYGDGVTITQLAKFQLGGTIFFGWTANYARYREMRDGFLGAALQDWQSIVNQVTEEIKRRIK